MDFGKIVYNLNLIKTKRSIGRLTFESKTYLCTRILAIRIA